MGNANKKGGVKRGKDGGKKTRGNTPTHGSKDATAAQVEDLLKKGSVSDYYDVDYGTVLGRGHYAKVVLGKSKVTGEYVAVKLITISKSRVEALKREVDILRRVGRHPNIVTLYDMFITDTELILVLELLQGGELFDRLIERGCYSEREASHHIRKIGQALKFLHRAGIVHRDLKPENLLLAHRGDDSELKIADFGLANIVDNVENATMTTVCGTWAYAAPEVKTSIENGQANYTAKVDLWSVGVILFVILAAYHPFDPDGNCSDSQLWENICKGEFDFNDPAWDTISPAAKDLIRKLIVVDPDRRYSTDELLNHPWIRQGSSVPATPITPTIDKTLNEYKRRSRKSVGSVIKNALVGSGLTSADPQQQHVAYQQQLQMQQQQLLLEQQLAQQQQHVQNQQRQAEANYAAAQSMPPPAPPVSVQQQQQQQQQRQQVVDPVMAQYEQQVAAQMAQQHMLQQQELLQQQHIANQYQQQQQRGQTVRFADQVGEMQNVQHDNRQQHGHHSDMDDEMELPKLTLDTLLPPDHNNQPTAMDLETPMGHQTHS